MGLTVGSRWSGEGAGAMVLCATTQVFDTPIQSDLQENLEPRPNINPLVNDPIVTSSG